MVAQAQKSQANPTVADVKWTNSIVELARKFQDKGIKLKRIDESQLCVFGFHDAAWANVSLDQESPDDVVWDTDCKKASQLASLVMIGDRKCLANQPGNIGIVDWRSKSSSRICRSTFAGETMACSDAMESAIYLRGLLLSFLHVGLVDSAKAREMIPLHLFTDCRSLYDHLRKDGVPKPPTEKRLALDLAAMRMELNEEGKAQWKLRYGERAELRPDRAEMGPHCMSEASLDSILLVEESSHWLETMVNQRPHEPRRSSFKTGSTGGSHEPDPSINTAKAGQEELAMLGRRMRALLRQLMWRHLRRAARKRPFLVAKLGLQVVVGTLFSRFVQKPDEKVKVH
ncbi:unnamed protein product [Cladocopium goreaui]|uniref:Copia protein n=1 Tax=Cladocopium goreaui TaxID=2562237 RepID=A0A9P1GPZ5_9DINO|nr:unnamed protein product [Cladocopium goreaui]